MAAFGNGNACRCECSPCVYDDSAIQHAHMSGVVTGVGETLLVVVLINIAFVLFVRWLAKD